MKKIFALSLVLLTTLAACGRKAAETEEYPLRIETRDGLKTVHNPDFPKEGRSTPPVIEEISIGEREGAEEYIFNRPQWIRVDDEGRIYVMDWGYICIKVFDAQGRHLRTFGRQGEGPGEFDVPSWFDLAPNERIVIMDGRNQRVTVFGPEGEHLGDFRVEGFHSEMVCDSSGRAYCQHRTAKREVETVSEEYQSIPYSTTVWRADLQGNNREKVGDFEGESSAIRRTPEGGSVSLGGSLRNLWTVDPQDRFLIGFNGRIDFTVYGPDLKPQFRFLRDFVPVKSPFYRGDAWQNEFHPALERFFILTDDQGNIWMERAVPPTLKEPEDPNQEPEWIQSPDHIYDIFDREGVYAREWTFPFRISCLKGEKVYAMVRDDEGYVSIKRFRLGL